MRCVEPQIIQMHIHTQPTTIFNIARKIKIFLNFPQKSFSSTQKFLLHARIAALTLFLRGILNKNIYMMICASSPQ